MTIGIYTRFSHAQLTFNEINNNIYNDYVLNLVINKH